MQKILNCRRSLIAIFSIVCLTGIAIYIKTDISGIAMAITGICGGVSAANSYENVGKAQAQAQMPPKGQGIDGPSS